MTKAKGWSGRVKRAPKKETYDRELLDIAVDLAMSIKHACWTRDVPAGPWHYPLPPEKAPNLARPTPHMESACDKLHDWLNRHGKDAQP